MITTELRTPQALTIADFTMRRLGLSHAKPATTGHHLQTLMIVSTTHRKQNHDRPNTERYSAFVIMPCHPRGSTYETHVIQCDAGRRTSRRDR
ncbi:MAG: hypothetical protein Q8O31_08175 [Rhodocyclaceae bacterium]|nr:hypothetical protein [Rhodocyclaceae bacterium]